MVKKKSPPARRRAPQRVERTATRGAAAAVLVLTVLFLAVRWNTFAAPFERDEGEYAYAAWLMRQGILPYENSFMQKPPMVIYTYLAGQAAGGGGGRRAPVQADLSLRSGRARRPLDLRDLARLALGDNGGAARGLGPCRGRSGGAGGARLVLGARRRPLVLGGRRALQRLLRA